MCTFQWLDTLKNVKSHKAVVFFSLYDHYNIPKISNLFLSYSLTLISIPAEPKSPSGARGDHVNIFTLVVVTMATVVVEGLRLV